MTKILIIENDPAYLKKYQESFTSEGYEIETATDGQEGMEKIKSFHPVLILLDVMILNPDGIEVLEKITNDPRTKDIPVIMISNLSGGKIAKKVLEEGAAQYVSKDTSGPKEILSIVKAILSKYTNAKIPRASEV